MTEWFRSWHGAPTDPKWLGVARKAGVASGIAVAVAWALMDRASQAEMRGSIEGYDADGLACFFGCEAEQVDAIVAAMDEKGILVDGRFSNWEKRQPKREDNSTERVRKHRERAKSQLEHDETRCNAPDTDTEKEEDISPIAPLPGVGDTSSSTKPEVDAEAPSATDGEPRKAGKRGRRIDPAWKPDEAGRAFAAATGIPAGDIDRLAAEFVDYWAGVGGAKGTKVDWPATWRNRCRQIAEFKGYRPAASATAPPAPSARPSGWPSNFPDPERLFQIWTAGKWSMSAWGFPPGDAGCQLPRSITDEWQKRRVEAA